MMCSLETDSNFVFCVHGKSKIDYTIKLVITDNKEPECEQKVYEVQYCPFCGFSEAKRIYSLINI